MPCNPAPSTRLIAAIALALASASSLGGCSPSPEREKAASPDGIGTPVAGQTSMELTPDAKASQTNAPVQGGMDLVLTELSTTDVEGAKLTGELACSFVDASDRMILLAQGDVASAAHAQGIVKVSGQVERVSAPGGFDAMLNGVRFQGRGMTATITVTGKPRGNSESPPQAALLTVEQTRRASTTVKGDWICGP